MVNFDLEALSLSELKKVQKDVAKAISIAPGGSAEGVSLRRNGGPGRGSLSPNSSAPK